MSGLFTDELFVVCRAMASFLGKVELLRPTNKPVKSVQLPREVQYLKDCRVDADA